MKMEGVVFVGFMVSRVKVGGERGASQSQQAEALYNPHV